MVFSIKLMLLGLGLILLSVAANCQISLEYWQINTFIGRYAHFVGVLILLYGFFDKVDE